MKEISKILLLFIFSYTLSGCYTVAWQPGEDLPTKDNIKQDQSNFYSVKDFGVFNDYYYSAWWLNPDNDFLRDNLNAVYDLENNRYFDLDEISIMLPVTPMPACTLYVAPIIVIPIVSPIFQPRPTKRRNTVSLPKSPPTRDKNSNKNKLRNNNGGRKTTKGRNR